MNYSVRTIASNDAEADLTKLWRANLRMRGDVADKYQWFYRGNPLGHALAFLLDAVTADGNVTVGCCGLGERLISVDGVTRRAGLLADFAVDHKHRTVMPAMMVQRAVCDYSHQHFELTYAFPNESAVGVLARAGLQTLGRMGRFARVLRTAPYASRYVRVPSVATGAGALLDAGIALAGLATSPKPPRPSHLAWLTRADARFDALWDRARPAFRCIGMRDSNFLNWRFADRPGLPGRFGALIDSENGDLHAYAAIVEKDPGVALLADFLAESPDFLAALVHRLWSPLRQKGFHTAVSYFLGPHAIEAALTSAGFRFRNRAKFIVVGPGRAPIDPNLFKASAAWYLTEADRDN
jgi:hypothetical protein